MPGHSIMCNLHDEPKVVLSFFVVLPDDRSARLNKVDHKNKQGTQKSNSRSKAN